MPHCSPAIVNGIKQFELRRNDRAFQCGDDLHLREWDPESREYTGRELFKHVAFVLEKHEGLAEGFVLMGLVPG